MSWKKLALAALCIATITACTAVNPGMNPRAAGRAAQFERTASISGGACDDVGQFIPAEPMILDASAAPTHR